MPDRRDLICITCPMGCQLDVLFDAEDSRILEIEGHSCRSAREYAQEELTSPTRMVTTTVVVKRGVRPLVPVHTAEPIPKSAVFPLMEELRNVEVEAPVRCGQVVLANGAGSGVDVVASRDLRAIEENA